ncbi:MAG: hydrogenase iron-sulfur subunit [Dissulfurimicrobium sp.]|uniref:hydrogenase iron-sulfur subunit n=1 Tax=Dissulfurimicrobium TaxID=1769732 RepID=UPI001ED9F981|nr:hydrogenase iron-sulfur subunit [Dissulfurimicrobium hydrothermale]UKL14038.1 hydrogenase iron-sulfur subunit [Dissulfurimicrobium hydrothermale]
MSDSNPKIVGFCCNYTISVSAEAIKETGLLPDGVQIERVPCTGRLELTSILDAFSAGADAVFVAGCPVDGCHNLNGSRMAAKRVKKAGEILKELDMNPELVGMFFVPRGESGPVVDAAREMIGRVRGEKK